MAIADRFDGFLIDLDGTVWLGDRPVEGAGSTISRLRDAGKEVVFVTNDARGRPAELAARLDAAGIPAAPDRILTAGAVTAQLTAEACGTGAEVVVLGPDALREELDGAGLTVLDGDPGRPVKAVVVALHSGFAYHELRDATAALHRGAALFATNREPTLPMPDGPWPGTGAILAAVEYASGRTATIGGKPERHLFERASRLVGGARVAMVGDGIGSDVAGAAAAGLGTILVLTGNTSADELETAPIRPDHVLASIAELV